MILRGLRPQVAELRRASNTLLDEAEDESFIMAVPTWHELARKAAADARHRAYAPYSGFQVGAAIVAGTRVVTGANIENASFGATICAERVAACAAWSRDLTQWQGMAIAAEREIVPCGICLQFLSELSPRLPLLLVNTSTNESREVAVHELLPHRFSGDELQR